MRRSTWLVPIFAAVMVASSARAEAITLREIVELTRAGLSDEVTARPDRSRSTSVFDRPRDAEVAERRGRESRRDRRDCQSGRMPQPQPDPVVR
jgi:hypothetical protein